MKSRIKSLSPEELFILCLIPVLLAGFGLYVYIYYFGSDFMYCAFREQTGLYCPGCGISRAAIYLIRGDILASLYYHPFVPYIAVVLACFLIKYLSFKLNLSTTCPRLQMRWGYIGLAIILVQFVIKNGLLIFCGIRLV